MKKKFLLLTLSIVLVFSMLPPQTGQALELDEINQQLNELQEQSRQAEKQQQDAQNAIVNAQAGKKKTQAELDVISEEIDAKVNEMMSVSKEIDQAEYNLEENGRQLEEANKRIKERSELLDERVRLMYMNGSVSYLDVLFNATSFTDFITRLDSIEMIARSDKQLLDDHKQDKQLVLEKKQEIESELERVRTLYAKLDQTKQDLMNKEKEKEVMIASFDEEIEEMHSLSEEQERMLVEIAQSRSKLNQQRVAAIEKQREEERRKQQAAAHSNSSSGSSSSSSSSGLSGGRFAVPLKDSYYISSRYGTRTDPITGRKGAFHSGLDLAAPGGTPIYAAESGVVIMAEWWSGYGNCVIIDHGGGVWTLYGHIRNGGIKVSKGDEVKIGDKIAEVGTTGNSTGNHLHFEVRVDGAKVDPEPYLK